MSAIGQHWKWKTLKEKRIQSPEHIEKCRQSKIGKKRSDMIGNTLGFKKGQKPWNFGLTKETSEKVKKIGEKISQKRKGVPLSEEHKKKIGQGGKNKKRSEQTKFRMSQSKRGNKNPAWVNGYSALGYAYPIEWTRSLKQQIRKRDNFICCICLEYPSTIVHHIDYDKKNCESDNLITVCRKCHSKTNNNREFWTNNLYEKFKNSNFVRN